MSDFAFNVEQALPEKCQAHSYAELENIASNGNSYIRYGGCWKDVLAHLYLKTDSLHSFRFTRFAYADQTVIGHVTSFLHQEELSIEQKTVEYAKQYLRLRYIRPWIIDFVRRTIRVKNGRINTGDFHINSLAVLPEFRGHGVAAMLFRKVASAASQSGANNLSLEVSQRNKNAIAIYRHWGFSVEDVDGMARYGPILLMKKKLRC